MTRTFDAILSLGDCDRARAMVPPWRHHFHFKNFSTGGEWNEKHMDFIDANLPPFKGKTVLDIGFCDGYYTFKAEAEGARSVVGVDIYFRPAAKFVHRVLESEACLMEEDVATWEDNGKFDVVLCLGLFYHVPNLTALIKTCGEKTRPGGLAILEGPVMGGRLNKYIPLPRWVSLADHPADYPNYYFWMPTFSALRALLEIAGFDVLDFKFMWSRVLITARRRLDD